jgi:hypothetical protein
MAKIFFQDQITNYVLQDVQRVYFDIQAGADYKSRNGGAFIETKQYGAIANSRQDFIDMMSFDRRYRMLSAYHNQWSGNG